MTHRVRILTAVLLICRLSAGGQTFSLSGQASGWTSLLPGNSPVSRTGLRYLPDLTIGTKLANGCAADAELSLNGDAGQSLGENQHPEFEAHLKLYRASVRIASDEFEVRGGLQKISFGPATLFRSLMWFDRVDPRDPLQLTDGVYGLLARYYFLNNANIWAWGLYGNNDPRGWDIAPTVDRSVEYGGRIQTPLGTGETGLSFHHRRVNYAPLGDDESSLPEDRIALDGKWNIGIGAWFEAVLTRTRARSFGTTDQHLLTLGADYTFDLGDGLTVLTEYFRYDSPPLHIGPGGDREFSALSLTYPLGLLDRVSAIVYHDWSANDWYRIVTWQRTYDSWVIYLLGFWNPQQIQLYRTQESTGAFAGTGVQLMLVFNH